MKIASPGNNSEDWPWLLASSNLGNLFKSGSYISTSEIGCPAGVNSRGPTYKFLTWFGGNRVNLLLPEQTKAILSGTSKCGGTIELDWDDYSYINTNVGPGQIRTYSILVPEGSGCIRTLRKGS